MLVTRREFDCPLGALTTLTRCSPDLLWGESASGLSSAELPAASRVAVDHEAVETRRRPSSPGPRRIKAVRLKAPQTVGLRAYWRRSDELLELAAKWMTRSGRNARPSASLPHTM